MVWKEGGGLTNSRQGITTNLQAYFCSNFLSMGDNTNLHGHSGWSKTKENFDGVLKALIKEHQWGTVGAGG